MEAYRQHPAAPAMNPVADPFESELRAIARELREELGPELSGRDREFLYDLAREEARYPMPTVRKICRLSRRARRPELRERFANLILAESLPAIEPCLRTAFDLETPAPGEADPLQRALEQNPTCPHTWQRCRDALARQLARTRVAFNAVMQIGWRTVS